MNTPIIVIMLLVSLGIGLAGLLVFLWALRNGQFDDAYKITHGALFDSVEDLNLANTIAQSQQADPNPTNLKQQGVKNGALHHSSSWSRTGWH